MSQQREQIRTIEDIDLIVDADAHLREGPDEIVPYLDEPWSELYGTTDDPEKDTLQPPKVEYPSKLGGKLKGYGRPTAEDKREIQERYGMDYLLLTSGGYTRATPVFSDDRLAHAMASAYNDYLVEEFLDEGYEGIKGLAYVPTHDPERGVEEIERVASHPDPVGLFTSSTGIFPPLGHQKYDPIYEAMEQYDLPLVLHPQKIGL